MKRSILPAIPRYLPRLIALCLCTCTCILPIVGCADSDLTARTAERSGARSAVGWRQLRLPNVSRPAAYDAASHAMRQWFRLADASPDDGFLRGVPTEYDQKGGTGRLRDSIDYQNRMRRTATIEIREIENGCLARCRVDVERLDTADHQAFQQNERFDDLPNSTPIQRDAGISAKQQQVWTPMPRDRELERQILDVIQNQFKPPAPA